MVWRCLIFSKTHPLNGEGYEVFMSVKIKLVKSLIGSKQGQILTAKSLGLKKPGDETVQPDNAATQGKIKKITHLIKVES